MRDQLKMEPNLRNRKISNFCGICLSVRLPGFFLISVVASTRIPFSSQAVMMGLVLIGFLASELQLLDYYLAHILEIIMGW